MKKSWVVLLVGAVFAVGAIGVYAMDGEGKCKRNMLESADTNHDGKVSYEEFKAEHEKHMQEMFKKLDTNGDGFIDESERKAGHEKMREKMKEMRKDHKMEGDSPAAAPAK
jgi:hypothetical protein